MANASPMAKWFADQKKDELARKSFAAIVRKNNAMVNKHIAAVCKLFGNWYVHTYISANGYQKELRVTLQVFGLPSFKDSKLEAVLDYLHEEFLSADDTKDWPASLSREYGFYNAVGTRPALDAITVRFVVDASVSSDSPTCRRVIEEVVTRTYEDTKYKIICD